MLEDPRARFTALAIDIGDGDMRQIEQYADSFYSRLADRGIPTSALRSAQSAWTSPLPTNSPTAVAFPAVPRQGVPRFWQHNGQPAFTSWLGTDTTMPRTTRLPRATQLPSSDEHVPRSLPKAIDGRAYYDGDQLQQEPGLRRQPRQHPPPCWSRRLGHRRRYRQRHGRRPCTAPPTGALGRRVPVVGIGFLPCRGDPDYRRGASVSPRSTRSIAYSIR